jgi:hypothetical protein
LGHYHYSNDASDWRNSKCDMSLIPGSNRIV